MRRTAAAWAAWAAWAAFTAWATAIGAGCGNPSGLDDLAAPADLSAPIDTQVRLDGEAATSDGSAVDAAAAADASLDGARHAERDAEVPVAPLDGGAPDLTMAFHALEILGAKDGLGAPVIDASPDEAGNLWAVTSDALYIRRAGQSRFRRYTNLDGLHIDTQVLSVAGGGVGHGFGEGYVGLLGVETGNEDDAPAIREPGKAEHVTLHADGSLTSLWYKDMHTDVSANFWITRSAYRLLYVHDGAAAGHVFMGGNHGVTHIFEDRWGDHVHVEVYYLPEHSGSYGFWNGLAMDPTTGGLWTCGKEACGLQAWNADPRAWVSGRYEYAFTVFTGDHALEVPHGYRENFVGAAATPDGTAYFLSRDFGLARWHPTPGAWDYHRIANLPVPGLGTPVDVAADSSGIVFVADTDKVLRIDPRTDAVTALPLPVSDVRRLYVDGRVTPRALYVSSGSGVVIYRGP